MAGLIQIGQSALAAAYTQLQTGGHNIANVHTPGYVRQEVQLATAGGQYHGHGYIGNGVEVQDVRRAYDRFMADEVTRSTSLAGTDAVRAQQLGQVDNLLADTETGIGVAMDEFRAALGDLVNQPADGSARAVIAARANTVANRFSETSQKLEAMVGETGRRLEDSAQYVNARLEQVASLNRQITQSYANGHQPNDMLDQRDSLINELASKIQMTRDDQPDGSVNLYSANGHSLVLSERAAQLKTVPGDADSARTRLMLDIHGKQVEMSESTLGSGEIAGLLRFRDQDLLAVQASLGRMAAAFAGAYNAQQARGLDANGKRGQAMFEVGKPVVQAADNNQGNAKLEVSVLDTSQLKAADYRLSFHGGVYHLEDVVSKTRRELPRLPVDVDGLRISMASGAMADGDSMMIQAGTAYAGRMRSVLRDGSAIASSDVMTVAGNTANRGYTNVRQLVEVEDGKGGLDPVKITFTPNNRYRVEVKGNAMGPEQEYEPGKPFDVEANGWKLTLSGRPEEGDVLEMKARSAPRQDNGNARAMTLLADRSNVDGATFSQAFASLLSDVGSRALQAKTSERASAKMLEGAKTVLANRSGVNLDEEAARLLQYRQAYQAAAKVIQTADEMFNSILALAR